jgi:hypothetical protein
MIHAILIVLHYLVFILFGIQALLITIPAHLIYAVYRLANRDSKAPAPKPLLPWVGRRIYHDIAFAAFFVLALIALWTSYLIHDEFTLSGGSTDLGAVVGIGVIGVFGIPLVISLVLGPGLSLFLWRNNLLLILLILSIVVFLIVGNLGFEKWPVILLPFAVILTASSLVWWVRLRRTWKQSAPKKK